MAENFIKEFKNRDLIINKKLDLYLIYGAQCRTNQKDQKRVKGIFQAKL